MLSTRFMIILKMGWGWLFKVLIESSPSEGNKEEAEELHAGQRACGCGRTSWYLSNGAAFEYSPPLIIMITLKQKWF